MSKHDRQSFLGKDSERRLKNTKVGIIGLGGGGSHVAQQLAHIGVSTFVLVDPDHIEDSNLNRLVGGTLEDVAKSVLKIQIAERLIRGVVIGPSIQAFSKPWQEVADALKDCDVIIGGIDSVIAKDELDRFCRRFLIPYIDMGMDVHKVGERFLIAGQVVLTSPNAPCLRCMGIVTEESMAVEAKNYGAAGGKPQVVWPNGVLASTAVGLFTQLICPWHDKVPSSAYLEYDGNKHTVVPSKSFALIQAKPCPHFHPNEVGEAIFDIRQPASASTDLVASPQAWLKRLWHTVFSLLRGC